MRSSHAYALSFFHAHDGAICPAMEKKVLLILFWLNSVIFIILSPILIKHSQPELLNAAEVLKSQLSSVKLLHKNPHQRCYERMRLLYLEAAMVSIVV